MELICPKHSVDVRTPKTANMKSGDISWDMSFKPVYASPAPAFVCHLSVAHAIRIVGAYGSYDLMYIMEGWCTVHPM